METCDKKLSGKKILVVEDYENTRLLIRELIGDIDKSVEVIEAKDGQEGLALFRDNREKLTMIITDHNMPPVSDRAKEITGQEMIEIMLKEGFDSSKIVMHSGGLSDPAKKKEIERLGVEAICKSGDETELRNAISRRVKGEVLVGVI